MDKMYFSFRVKKNIFRNVLLLSIIVLVSCNMPQKSKFTPITVGEKISTDNFEFFISHSIITIMADSNDLGINFNLPVQDNSIYFIIIGQIKNTSNSTISIIDNINAKLLFDNKYKYEVSIEPNEKLKQLVPLSSEQFVLYTSVPFEILTSTSDYEYQINFDKQITNTNSSFNIYGKNKQYDSAKNIVNFHVFTEKILQVAANFSGFSVKEINEKNNIIIFRWDNSYRFPISDLPDEDILRTQYLNRYFEFTPELWLMFDSDFIESANNDLILDYGTMIIDVNIDDRHSKWAFGGELTIASDAGSIKSNNLFYRSSELINDNDRERYIFPLENMARILSGNNLDLTFEVYDGGLIKYNKSPYDKSINCESSLKNAMLTLINFYTECPISSLTMK